MAFSKRISLRGFSLIELLAVIAIIGVISSLALAALNTARNKGTDATVKSSLDSARKAAELFYDANSNAYVSPGGATSNTDVCSATGLVGGVKGIYTQISVAASASGILPANIQTVLANNGNVAKATCHAGDSTHGAPVNGQWAAEVPLKNGTNQMYCVDSTGWSGATTGSTLAANDTLCN